MLVISLLLIPSTSNILDKADNNPKSSALVNLALSKPVTVSSVEKSGLEGGYAVDGNTATRWSSEFSDPQWIYVDLQSNYNINRIILNWEAAYGTAYEIQVSNDTSSWTTVYSTDNSNGEIDDFCFDTPYGLVLMLGLLQFMSFASGNRFVRLAQKNTLPGGIHLAGVFTDAVPVPADLAPFIKRLFREGEIRDMYAGWEIELFKSYIKDDEHEGGIRHRHAINGLIAVKPHDFP